MLPKYQRSNQSTCIDHRPLVNVGDEVHAGHPIADGPSTDHGELALGQNLTVAYMSWEGYNYEDAIVVSERVVAEDLLTTISISRHEIDARDTKLGPEEITREVPNLSEDMLANLDEDGIIRIGAEVGPGDILVGKVTPKGESTQTAEERLLKAIFGAKAHDVRDTSLQHAARRLRPRHRRRALQPRRRRRPRARRQRAGARLRGAAPQDPAGRQDRRPPRQQGRHLRDPARRGHALHGRRHPVDVILNPLGVPSRMNVGQLLECHLGWAAASGWDSESTRFDKYVPGPFFVSTPVFDGAKEDEIADVIRRANKNVVNLAKQRYGEHMRPEFVTQLDSAGKTTLYDGRSGEEFREPITVGTSYILKLGHMVDDKIHRALDRPLQPRHPAAARRQGTVRRPALR